LIEIRTGVMTEFENAHRASSVGERNRCKDLLANLKSEDDQLQSNFRKDLKSCDAKLRQVITSGSATPVGAYKSRPSPGCLDRKV